MKNSIAFISFNQAKYLFFLALVVSIFPVLKSSAQARTITGSGTWSSTGIWSGGLIADVIGETTSINNNVGTVTVAANYTIGSVTMNNGNTLTINSGVTLNIGQSGTPQNLTSGNTGTINVVGTLIIWGDLIAGNSLDLNVSPGGVLIVKGNVVGGNNTDLVINGAVTVDGSFSVGNGANVTGSGTVSIGGSCSDGNSGICGTGPLPIKLLSFSNTVLVNGISTTWVTSMEKDVDYFQLERASSNLDFKSITKVESKGGLDVTTSYSFVDVSPINGKNYYRLKSVDVDGAFTYSRVIFAEWKSNEGKIGIYPNPIENQSFNLDLNDNIVNPEKLSIYESRGYLIFETEINSTLSTIKLPGNVTSGVYVVKVSSSNGQHISRIIVP